MQYYIRPFSAPPHENGHRSREDHIRREEERRREKERRRREERERHGHSERPEDRERRREEERRKREHDRISSGGQSSGSHPPLQVFPFPFDCMPASELIFFLCFFSMFEFQREEASSWVLVSHAFASEFLCSSWKWFIVEAEAYGAGAGSTSLVVCRPQPTVKRASLSHREGDNQGISWVMWLFLLIFSKAQKIGVEWIYLPRNFKFFLLLGASLSHSLTAQSIYRSGKTWIFHGAWISKGDCLGFVQWSCDLACRSGCICSCTASECSIEGAIISLRKLVAGEKQYGQCFISFYKYELTEGSD